MSPHDPTPSEPTGLTSRAMLQAGTSALAISAVAAGPNPSEAAGPAAAVTSPVVDADGAEWRNRKPGMAYRRLGRTGLMISEVVSGGDPITLKNYKHLALAIEMGLNYLDMAPAYNGGDTERAYGALLAARPGLRQEVFLATKISNLKQRREALYRKRFDSLPAAKQAEIRGHARELRAKSGVDAPGYFLTYFPGQPGSIEGSYLRAAMLAEFGASIEADPSLRAFVRESLEGSLKRVGTDHFDIVMCPHGADAPDDVRSPYLAEVFAELKTEGKLRFMGVTAHNDPGGIVRAAADAGHYDVVMMAYNVINGGYVEDAIRHAAAKGVGLIAMKSAHAVATHHKALQPVPDWRVAKVERIVPGDWKTPQKAYLWSLHNPNIAAVISNLWDEAHVRENLALAGQTIELRPA